MTQGWRKEFNNSTNFQCELWKIVTRFCDMVESTSAASEVNSNEVIKKISLLLFTSESWCDFRSVRVGNTLANIDTSNSIKI